MTIATELANRICGLTFDALPDEAVHWARVGILDTVGVTLAGALSPALKVPLLGANDMFAEKLLANADRCFDRAVAYRDAIDLGRLADTNGGIIPPAAIEKAEAAYGQGRCVTVPDSEHG